MVENFVQDFLEKNLTMVRIYGRIDALRKLARRQFVNRQNIQKYTLIFVKNAQIMRETAKNQAESRNFSLFRAMFG